MICSSRRALVSPLRRTSRVLSSLLVVVVAVGVCAAHAAPVRMAVMGDSISAGSGVSGGSPNWVAQLAPSGAIAFHNLAQGGATATDVIDHQLNTAVNLAQTGAIDVSVLMIGGNDAVAGAYSVIAGGNPQTFVDAYVNNVKTILDAVALANPGVQQVYANMPDVTVTGAVQSVAAGYHVPASVLQLFSQSIAAANAQTNAYALAHGIPVIDMYAASHEIIDQVPFTLAGHTFSTALAPDQFHPAVFTQGLLANLVDAAFNEGFGQALPVLSDQQIVTSAGYVPNAGPSYFDLHPFLLLPVPEPSSDLLAIFACAGLLVGNAIHNNSSLPGTVARAGRRTRAVGKTAGSRRQLRT